MMAVLLVAGIGILLAGLLALGFGIPVKEFSFGNTLIVTGVIGACTGAVLLGLWIVARELKNVARRLGSGISVSSHEGEPAVATSAPRNQPADTSGFLFSRDAPGGENAAGAESGAQLSPPTPPPWHEDARGPRAEEPPAPEPAEAGPAAKPKRNLLFSSTSKKERERAQARTSEPLAPDLLSSDLRPNPAAPPVPEPGESPPATFDDAWPKPERARGEAPPRRSPRTPSTFAGANAAGADQYPPVAPSEDPPAVTVLKSGVVDGMAYSLYSDGSIEAQMPEGMMRFASIDELRAHLDQRP